ncbi:MAG TPA: hypothetical protein VHL57_00530 [Flavobacteriales bacterium]|nr:hypothetical protein [Flavobacteriales bacterium]
MRYVLLLGPFLLALSLRAQTPVPLLTPTDRFLVFEDGTFTDLEARKPQAVFQNGDRLAYISDGGDLKLFDHGRITVLQRGETVEMKGSRHQLAWKVGPSLRIPKGDGSTTLCHGAGSFFVTDSLIVYYDQLQRTVNAYWHDQVVPIADALMVDDVPGLQVGANLATLFDPAGRRVLLFQGGRTSILLDGVSEAPIAVGCDVVAYVDERDGSFHVMDKGQRLDLEAFPPTSFKAGSGLVAYITNTGAFRCYVNGNIYPLGDFTPSDYWVQDSVLLFVDQGQLKAFVNDRIEVVERFLPETWAICGNTIAYLDINRQPRLFRLGVRTLVSKEAGVKKFDLYPGALAYRSNSGVNKVWWRGRLYER